MNQDISGMIRAIRYLRSTISIIALVFIILLVLMIVVLLGPLEDIFKYILTGVIICLGVAVYIAFWQKAKKEPLSATEEYWIASLPYAYGSEADERGREEEFELPKVAIRKLLPPPGKKDKKGDKEEK